MFLHRLVIPIIANFLCCMVIGQASVIVLTSSPAVVKEGLTPSLTLRCGLQSTAGPSTIIGRRSVTSTTDDVTEVSSLILMRNGQDVATVSHSSPAHLTNSSVGFQVSGNVQTGGAEQGYIEMTINNPTQDQLGQFSCEVNAVSKSGHAVVFTKTLEISSETPTVLDLVTYVRDLEARIQELEHTEKGKVHCGDSNTWTAGAAGAKTKVVSVSFQTAYAQPPTVQLGVSAVDMDSTHNVRHNIAVVSVDVAGFTVQCLTWSDTHYYSIDASWISVAS